MTTEQYNRLMQKLNDAHATLSLIFYVLCFMAGLLISIAVN